jgi:hypothetical protein
LTYSSEETKEEEEDEEERQPMRAKQHQKYVLALN